jgi:hypothetical protein
MTGDQKINLVHSLILNECQKMIMCLCVAVMFPSDTFKHLANDVKLPIVVYLDPWLYYPHTDCNN